MPFQWPGVSAGNTGGLPEQERAPVQDMLITFSGHVEEEMEAAGLPRHISPLFRPWNVSVLKDKIWTHVVFGTNPGGGVATVFWLGRESLIDPDVVLSVEALASKMTDENGWEVTYKASFMHPDHPQAEEVSRNNARRHVEELERQNALSRLGDLTGVGHLEPYLRQFLEDHPQPDRNVFVMMRFHDNAQLNEAFETIRAMLAERGFHAVRADDRAYTDGLWDNIEVYLTGCTYGIALFEQVEQRDFNPNVALELGYMFARRKRCLILKEKSLPALPSDLIHRLYKPWDSYNVAESVRREVSGWIDNDLRLT